MSRLVGGTPSIDSARVRGFFDQRAGRVQSAEPLTSVLYQDSDPDLAVTRDRHEKSVALPLLRLAEGESVLDAGCGIGRWAGPVLAAGASYWGADPSGQFLDAARAAHPAGTFVQLPVQELTRAALGREDGFTRVLVAGVLLYLNDDELEAALAALAGCAARSCLLYLREPLALEQRLTLQAEWSAELGTEYSAVYRTRDDLVARLDRHLGGAGFRLTAEGDLYPAHLNNRAETRQRYLLLERG